VGVRSPAAYNILQLPLCPPNVCSGVAIPWGYLLWCAVSLDVHACCVPTRDVLQLLWRWQDLLCWLVNCMCYVLLRWLFGKQDKMAWQAAPDECRVGVCCVCRAWRGTQQSMVLRYSFTIRAVRVGSVDVVLATCIVSAPGLCEWLPGTVRQ
jgi:hypothetical protein